MVNMVNEQMVRSDHYKTVHGFPPLCSLYNDANWQKFDWEIYMVDTLALDNPSGHEGQRLWLDGVLFFDDVDDVITGVDPIDGSDWWDIMMGYDTYKGDPVGGIKGWYVFGQYVNKDVGAADPEWTITFDDMIWFTPK